MWAFFLKIGMRKFELIMAYLKSPKYVRFEVAQASLVLIGW